MPAPPTRQRPPRQRLRSDEQTGSCKCGVAYLTRLTCSNRGVPYFHDPLSPRSDLRGEVFRLVKKGWRSEGAMWLIPEARPRLDLGGQ